MTTDAAQTATLCAGVTAALRAAGLPVARGASGRGVLLAAHGVGAVELRFRLARPAHLAAGQAWDADRDTDRMVARVVMALLADYHVTRSGTGTQSAVLMRSAK